eukprot:266197-Prorocentrum_minimum.AAC.1
MDYYWTPPRIDTNSLPVIGLPQKRRALFPARDFLLLLRTTARPGRLSFLCLVRTNPPRMISHKARSGFSCASGPPLDPLWTPSGPSPDPLWTPSGGCR